MNRSQKSSGPKQDKNVAVFVQQSSAAEIGTTPPVYLRNGPIKNRHCTDKFCCFLFLVIAAGFGYLLLETFMGGGKAIQNLSAP